MTKHIDENFEDRELLLDGNEYLRCIVKNCRLIYSGGELPQFKDSTFDSCQFIFDGSARRTLHFIGMLNVTGAKPIIQEMLKSVGINAKVN